MNVDINDLVEKINIVEYVSQYLELQENKGEYQAISPFSGKDTDPSFTITPSTGLWCDFSDSKSGGNVLNFIQKYHRVDFPEAIKIACEYVGGDVKELPESLEATKQIKKFKPPIKSKKEIKYKKLPDDIMLKYDDNPERIKPWIDAGISQEILQKYQVRYDAISNRIVFPIWNEKGEIINVKGRTLDIDFKAKGIKKYNHFYEIGRMDYVYNLNFAYEIIKKKNRVIIFESEKSVMLAETYGIKNTIAIMTSTINEYQMELLIKLGANIVFALDKDKDAASDESINKLKRYVKVQYIKDTEDVLGDKDAPIDRGYDIFLDLFLNRKTLR